MIMGHIRGVRRAVHRSGSPWARRSAAAGRVGRAGTGWAAAPAARAGKAARVGLGSPGSREPDPPEPPGVPGGEGAAVNRLARIAAPSRSSVACRLTKSPEIAPPALGGNGYVSRKLSAFGRLSPAFTNCVRIGCSAARLCRVESRLSFTTRVPTPDRSPNAVNACVSWARCCASTVSPGPSASTALPMTSFCWARCVDSASSASIALTMSVFCASSPARNVSS